jgi:AsmA protein
MGTLATRLLDLNALLEDVDFAAEADGRWSTARLPRRNFTRADLDLRISANRLQIGRVRLQDTGLSIQAANGKAEVTIAETRGYGGSMKARLSAARTETGYDLRASAAFANLDSTAFFAEAFRSQRLSGTVSGDIALAAEGTSLAEMTRSLRGSAQFQLSNGDVNGLDLELALRRLEKRPLSIASEVRTGRTAISNARVDFEIVAGLATIQKFEATAPGIEFDVGGTVSIARRLLDVSIRASQSGREGAEQAPQLSLGLKGNWDDPGLVIDARSLIRRSQAAAPLLRAPAKTGEEISAPQPSAAQ